MNGLIRDNGGRRFALFALLAMAVSGIFGAAMIGITRGHAVFPLDDSYIHFQYARRLAQGHLFEYTDGGGFSTGTTSILYPLLLSPFFVIGVKGAAIIPVAFAFGVFCFCMTAYLIYLSGRIIAHERVGMLAALLFLLNGHLAWSHLSGMETGLFGLLLAAGMYYIVRWWGERRGGQVGLAFFFLMLAALTRPEGFIILLTALIYILPRAWGIHGSRSLKLVFSLLPFAIYMLLVRLATGGFSTSGVVAKSIWGAPYYTAWERLARLADNFAYIFAGYYGNLSNNYFPDWAFFPMFPTGALYPFMIFPPGFLLLSVLGAAVSGARERANGQFGPTLLMALCLLAGLASVTISEVVPVHFFRYLVPFQSFFLILASLGLYESAKFFEAHSARVFRIAGWIFSLLLLPSLIYWVYIYGENCNDIFQQHRRMSWWIKDNTPPDAVIGVTDTGVIGYFSERRVYDFVGLTTPNQARHWRQGFGSAYERLEHLADDQLPDYIVTFPFVWAENNLLGQPLYNATLQKNMTTMSNDFVIYRQDWSFIRKGELPLNPPEGMILSDQLDVADLAQEAAHRFVAREAAERPTGWKFPNPRNFVFLAESGGRLIADGGRDLTESQIFTVRLAPGAPARLIARVEAERSALAEVFINGERAGNLEAADEKKGEWQEPFLDIPASLIREEQCQIRIVHHPESRAPFHVYHYWIYQAK
ncbi:MAG TPA: hypothetical protein PKW18_06530 [Candidatus Sumerlaeota bacterium]|nr:hypothetical protein [Candidatus Sumerlaeota bacterium]HON49624.1 hypothetical protein [Candidatus Sumerlaeota bacterium]HOR64776.1 hypothetical protein [Candidatus Sumerlaeota bacterium]HPL74213.1 hypothetical protein [Candidatus Sumerlaeota bacterium]HRU54297.1 hypothetical protein [Candidatus Sumerlaeia bacterium]